MLTYHASTDNVLSNAQFLHLCSAPQRLCQWAHTYEFLASYEATCNVTVSKTCTLCLNDLETTEQKWQDLIDVSSDGDGHWAATAVVGDYSYMVGSKSDPADHTKAQFVIADSHGGRYGLAGGISQRHASVAFYDSMPALLQALRRISHSHGNAPLTIWQFRAGTPLANLERVLEDRACVLARIALQMEAGTPLTPNDLSKLGRICDTYPLNQAAKEKEQKKKQVGTTEMGKVKQKQVSIADVFTKKSTKDTGLFGKLPFVPMKRAVNVGKADPKLEQKHQKEAETLQMQIDKGDVPKLSEASRKRSNQHSTYVCISSCIPNGTKFQQRSDSFQPPHLWHALQILVFQCPCRFPRVKPAPRSLVPGPHPRREHLNPKISLWHKG